MCPCERKPVRVNPMPTNTRKGLNGGRVTRCAAAERAGQPPAKSLRYAVRHACATGAKGARQPAREKATAIYRSGRVQGARSPPCPAVCVVGAALCGARLLCQSVCCAPRVCCSGGPRSAVAPRHAHGRATRCLPPSFYLGFKYGKLFHIEMGGLRPPSFCADGLFYRTRRRGRAPAYPMALCFDMACPVAHAARGALFLVAGRRFTGSRNGS
jgi:hypothetical protein